MKIKWRKYGLTLLICFYFTLGEKAQVTYSDTLIYDTVVHPTEHENETLKEEQREYYFLKNYVSRDNEDSFRLRELPPGEVKKMQQDEDFWYANASIKKKVRSEGSSFGSQTWFRTLLWCIIIGGFAAFIMIYLANSNVALFSRRNRSIQNETEEKVETDDIFAINYQKEIDKAINAGNHRLAVRLLFLRVLRKLAEKNIIQYKQGRTNFDYLLQLNPTNYYKDFFRITRNYEYSWYGQFNVSPETFDIIRKDVENFENNLK